MKKRTLKHKQERAIKDGRQSDLAAIHILKKEIGLGDDSYRAIVGGIMDRRGNEGRASAANLDGRGRFELLKTLRALRDRTAAAAAPRYIGNGPPNLYPKQAAYIGGLEEKLGWGESRMNTFIIRQITILKSVPMLTPSEATKVITGLKAVLKSLQP